MDDNRFYETFYGIELNDWNGVSFGSFSKHRKILVKEYVSDGCSTTTQSLATLTNKFIYPHHTKKKYFIEGVAEGQITFVASECTAYISKYRVTICKVNENSSTTELASTNWQIADKDNAYKTLHWHKDYNYGDEIVYHFFIEVWDEEKELGEFDRFYIKVQTDTSTCTVSQCTCARLMHSNDAEWEDLKITIPFRL